MRYKELDGIGIIKVKKMKKANSGLNFLKR